MIPGDEITVRVTLMTSYRLVPKSRTTIFGGLWSRGFRQGFHKAFVPAIVGMSGQIHADFLWLLWVLADKQMRSYYECMGKEDTIGNDAFRWARAKAFNSNKTIGRAITFGCATCCRLSVHSLAVPRSGSVMTPVEVVLGQALLGVVHAGAVAEPRGTRIFPRVGGIPLPIIRLFSPLAAVLGGLTFWSHVLGDWYLFLMGTAALYRVCSTGLR